MVIVCVVKVPLWPAHGWLPELHVESATEVSVCLASVLLKIGWVGVVKGVMCVELNSNGGGCLLFNGCFVDGCCSIGMVCIGISVMFCIDWKRLIAMWSLCHTGIVWCVIWHSDEMGMWCIGWGNVVHVVTAGTGFHVVGMLYSVVGIRIFCVVFGVWGGGIFTCLVVLVWWWWVELPGSGGFWCDLIIGGCGVVGGWVCDVYAVVFIGIMVVCFWTGVWVVVVCGFFTHLWRNVWVRVDVGICEVSGIIFCLIISSGVVVMVGCILWCGCGGGNGGYW